MKKLLAILLSACMLLTLAACSSTGSTADTASTASDNSTSSTPSTASDASDSSVDKKPGEGTSKVGIVLGGSKDDYGFNFGFYQLAQRIESELGVEVVLKESVPQNSEVEGVIEELISQGCGVIIPTQFGYLEYSKNVANRHPEVAFYSIPLTDYAGDNFSVLHGTIQDIWYLEGVLAGLYTETNNIGFVASIPIPDVIVAIDAFTLGAQSVNEDVAVNVVFTGSWDDTGLQTTSCNQLINDGADIIAPFQDTIKTIVEICAANGIHCFGCNSDAYELDPETWLSACVNSPEGWLEYIKKAIDGEYETVSVIGSMDVGLEDLGTYGDSVSEEIRSQVEAVKQQILDGTFHVFEGPVYDQNGNEVIASGVVPTFEEINNFNFLVQGVNGSLN